MEGGEEGVVEFGLGIGRGERGCRMGRMVK